MMILLIFIQLFIVLSNQFNLDGIRHNCLHVPSVNEKKINSHQIISYCLTEWEFEENDFDQNFTFIEMYEKNITSEELYRWSAPLDIIEHYQFYLDQVQLHTINLSSIETQLYYNCTLPRFGSRCEYELDIDDSIELPFNQIVEIFYMNWYYPASLTCYIDLICDRGSKSICLDWSEICDEKVDCLNDAVDEKYCWQLYINECEENEFRCKNGQCISNIFLNDHRMGYECLDRSDITIYNRMHDFLVSQEPVFYYEDIQCSDRFSVGGISLTSSCHEIRTHLLKTMMLMDTPEFISADCWLAFRCRYEIHSMCQTIDANKTILEVINHTCPDILLIPTNGVIYSHLYIGYLKENILNSSKLQTPEYICYNQSLCNGFYPTNELLFLNHSTCRRPKDFPVIFDDTSSLTIGLSYYAGMLFKTLSQCNTIIYSDPIACNSPFMYRCINSSKCIPSHNLCNGINDCNDKDDEYCLLVNDACSVGKFDTLFKCTSSDKCISKNLIGNQICDCGYDQYGYCDEETQDNGRIMTRIRFHTICNGFLELYPLTIDGRNETDETECDQWPCINNYTRCDGIWNCLNGADELNCENISCPSDHHQCVSPSTFNLTCLPVEKANDGHIDCVGATDELKYCRMELGNINTKDMYCKNDRHYVCIPSTDVCNKVELCLQNVSVDLNVKKFYCSLKQDRDGIYENYFRFDDINFPTTISLQHSLDIGKDWRKPQRCHRGLPLRVWLKNTINSTLNACLCPPSYYGDMCQYQTQRVSLTLRFHTFSESRRILFTLIISLIDNSNERIIHSYQQLTYYYNQHCPLKFNVYLIYSIHPVLWTKNYSVHIDVYEKVSMIYRASFFLPIKFIFLPVYRIATRLNIPPKNENEISCTDSLCAHGQCQRYTNDPKSTTFCQCNRGWSGKSCTIPYECNCDTDSLCIGISADNRSICVCPPNRWGARCLLRNNACHAYENMPCLNGGQCIPDDGHLVRRDKFICICSKEYSGERCEILNHKISLTFDEDIILPQAITFLFIQINREGVSLIGSLYKRIPTSRKTIVVHWSNSYHLALTRIHNNFYTVVPMKRIDLVVNITKIITSSDRCDHISNVLNKQIGKLSEIRRIKYFHLACQHLPLNFSCFYDDAYFCFCDFSSQRMANCFQLNSTMKHSCFGQNSCENGAECLQDKPQCPSTSICICPSCYYGIRCQFSTNLFSLSLDAILGYHIQPQVSMLQQPSIVKFSLALTVIITVGGLINSVLCLFTFKNKETRQLGCGIYLFGSSIVILFTMILFALKFVLLVVTQTVYINNRTFLNIQCRSIDFLLKTGLNMDQWLNACVAIERAIATIKGIRFNRKQSKQIAIFIILMIAITNIGTSIPDPLHRRLLDENDDDSDVQQRIWCIVRYPSRIQGFNLAMNLFHFCIPFAINLISTIVIIVLTSRQQIKVQTKKKYQTIVREQLRKHRSILIAPILFVLLALPRLIISIVSGCLKSTNESWIFLIGYFLAFIPLMITFLVFVLPSQIYKKEFRKTVTQIQQTLRPAWNA